MRNNQTWLRRHVLAAALTAIIAWPPEAAASNGDAAEVVQLSGDVAKFLRDTYQPVVPVMVAVAGEQLLAVVFDEDEGQIPTLLEQLFVPSSFQLAVQPLSGPACDPETGVTCCETSNGRTVLGATLYQQSGWIRLGEQCKAPSNGAGVPFIPISEEVSNALSAQLGIYSCFMELATDDYRARVLVNAPSRDSWHWDYCFRRLAEVDGTARILADASPESDVLWWAPSVAERRSISHIILAGHHGSPPPPQLHSLQSAVL